MFPYAWNNTTKAFQSGHGIAGLGRWLGRVNPYLFPMRANWKIASKDKKVGLVSSF
jgi:hypothetical protein